MRHPLILMYLGFGSYLWSGVLGGDFDVGTQNHFTAGGNSTWLSDNTTHPDNQRRWSGAAPAPVSDVDWERYKCKGRKLLLQMQLTDRDVGQALPVPQDTVQSQFHFGHLAPWGYAIQSASDTYRNLENDGTWGVANFFRHLGISTKYEEEGGDWKGFSIKHYTASTNPNAPVYDPKYMEGYQDPQGYHRRSTGAYHVIGALPRGFLMVQNTMGPKAATAKYFGPNNFPNHELPGITHLSDMLYIAWSFCPQRTWLQYFLSLTINNPETNAIISRVLNGQIAPEPKDFAIESDEGLALLGSPNGMSFAHMLIEHKAEVGHKYINKVWVWESESAHKLPCLMFGVQPVTTPAQTPQGVVEARDYMVRMVETRHGEQSTRNFLREHVIYV